MIRSKSFIVGCTLAALLSLGMIVASQSASAFDAAADFSTNSNPNGVWSYGWSSTLGGTFNTYTNVDVTPPGFERRYSGLSFDGWPGVERNSTGSNVFDASTLNDLQAGQLALVPGAGGQDSIVRWTAPAAGTFSIATSFIETEQDANSVDVHVLTNNVSIFNAIMSGFGNPTSFAAVVTVQLGETIDFVVGPNGFQPDDTTGLSATVVPEPGTVLLVGLGVGGLVVTQSRRKKSTP